MDHYILLLYPEVVVEEVEELLLHEIDFREGEVHGVTLPVLVAGRSVVEILGCTDKGGEEDTMTSACHT